MTNRKQLAWTFGFSEYDEREVAEQIAEMLMETDIAYLHGETLERLEKWLSLECDECGNWGKLPVMEKD